ncbi:MAG TPA: hypothetical protein GX709_04260 [Clostridiales bacterium]|nr:hypothetical protein [Clostridiales bacterium]
MFLVDLNPVVSPVIEIIDALLWPALALIGSIGTIYCIVLGVRLAKSDDQNSRLRAKKDLIGALIGFIVIFILIIALKIAMPILQNWLEIRLQS